jgi:hypothetical protein
MVSTERGGGTRGMLNLGGRARRGAALDAGDQRIMTAWDQRAIFALGAWLLLSPWIIGFAATVPLMWNSVIFGGFIFVLPVGVSLTIAAGGRRSHRAFSRRR